MAALKFVRFNMGIPAERKPRKDNRQHQVLESAARLFCERGYVGTSLRDIASEAGMLAGSIYYHFSSKEELLIQAYALGAGKITVAVGAAIEGEEDPWMRLEAASTAYVKALLVDKGFPANIIRVVPRHDPQLRKKLAAYRNQYEGIFRELTKALKLPKRIESELISDMLLGALTHVRTWYRKGGDSPAKIAGSIISEFRTGEVIPARIVSKKPPKTIRRQAKKKGAKHRDKIVDAAAYLFATKGFEETSVRDVAARVGRTSGALYYYFNSKDEMLAAVHERSKNLADQTFQNAVSGVEDPWERLELACAAQLSTIFDRTDYASVVAGSLPRADTHITEGVVAVRDRHEKKYRQLIDALELKPGRNRKYLRLALLGDLTYAQVLSEVRSVSPEELAHRFVTVFRYRLDAGATAR